MLATIINFSTNEANFLSHCLEEVGYFSDQILVCVCDHFFDGAPENTTLLRSIYASHPNVTFIQYPFSKKNFYGSHSPHFWHNMSRMIGVSFLKENVSHVLFLDVDEIVEGNRFAKWLRSFSLEKYAALRLANYWYFREAQYRAKEIEDTPTIICKAALHYDVLMQQEERAGMFFLAEGERLRFVSKEKPFVHHYSWVRDKEGLLRKTSCWGHRDERNWKELIEKEFSSPFSGKDFVHGYFFERVKPYLKMHSYSCSNAFSKNVINLSTRDVHKIDLRLKFGI